jgi:hypothetical protein
MSRSKWHLRGAVSPLHSGTVGVVLGATRTATEWETEGT